MTGDEDGEERHGEDDTFSRNSGLACLMASSFRTPYAQASKVFRGLKGRGFGRLDVRSDPAGAKLQLLEINPNCGIFYPTPEGCSADEILLAAKTEAGTEIICSLLVLSRSETEIVPRRDINCACPRGRFEA
jgi:hypothetical protein